MSAYGYIDIKSRTGQLLDSVLITQDAEIVEELMQNDYVELSWKAAASTPLPPGAYIEVGGERYRLLDGYTPDQTSDAYTYTPQFHSRVAGWKKVPFFFYTFNADNQIIAREPEWTLTDTPYNFMSQVIRAIQLETGEKWTCVVDSSLSGTQTVQFGATDIFSSLSSIAGVFNTEWRADKATNTLYLGKAMHGSAVTLAVDSNIQTPSVTNNSAGYYNRFYVFGSTRNVTQDYQGASTNNLVNKRLTLDPAKFPGGYIDIEDNLQPTQIMQKILTFDDIYPRAHLELPETGLRARLMYRLDESTGNPKVIGTNDAGDPIYDQYVIWYIRPIVSDTGRELSFNDKTYDPVDCPDGMLIKGKTLSVHFSSGALTGREFELAYHSKNETLKNSDGTPFEVYAGDFEILFQEEGGLVLPTGAESGIAPQAGDTLTLFNCRMPAEYTASAYAELEDVAKKEIAERYTADTNNYQFNSNPIAFKSADPGLTIGRAVHYVNGDYAYDTRVIKIVRKLDLPYEQTITIGNDRIKRNSETIKEEVTNANRNIDVLAALNNLTKNIQDSYGRAQQAMIEGFNRISKMWQFDEEGRIYTPYMAYSLKDVAAFGPPEGGSGGGGMSEEALAAYLTREGYATQIWVRDYVAANAPSVDLSNFITKVDAAKLFQPKGDYASASHIHSQYLTEHQDISHLLPSSVFDELFEKVNIDGTDFIKAKLPFFSVHDVAAFGPSSDISGGPGGTAYDRLDIWGDYSADKAGWVLSAALGYNLHTRLSNVYGKTTIDSMLGNYVTLATPQTIDGRKTFSEDTIVKQIKNNGFPKAWVDGRVGALLRTTAVGASTQYVPLWSAKSVNGSWDCGTYSSDVLYFSYIKDSDFNAGNNVQTAFIRFLSNGQIAANSFYKSGGTATEMLMADGSTKSLSDITFVSVADAKGSVDTTQAWQAYRTDLRARFFDVYDNGGPDPYGCVLEIAGRSGHWQPQLWFGGWANGQLRHRNRDYNSGTWGPWHTLLDTANFASILEGNFVKTTGDSMTGDLTVRKLHLQGGNEFNCDDKLWLAYRSTPLGINLCHGNQPLTYGSAEHAVLHAGNFRTLLDQHYVTLGTDQEIGAAKTFLYNVTVKHPTTTGGSARGFVVLDNAGTEKVTFGTFCNADVQQYAYIGWGANGWQQGNNLAVCSSFFRYKGNDVLHTANYASILDERYVNASGDMMTGPLYLGSASAYIFADSTYGAYLQNGTDYINLRSGKLFKNNSAEFLHTSNYSDLVSTLNQPVTIRNGIDTKLTFDNTDGESYTRITFAEKGVVYAHLTVHSEAFVFVGKPVFIDNRFGVGIQAPQWPVDVHGSVHSDDWFRSTGGGGWYSQTYGGGIYMRSAEWVETYNKPMKIAHRAVIGCNGFGVGLQLRDPYNTSIEVCAGNYTMGLGCHNNGNWYWWRGTSNPDSTEGKSYVMSFNGIVYNFQNLDIAVRRVYLDSACTVWLQYNAALDVIEASHTFVSHKDIVAFKP